MSFVEAMKEGWELIKLSRPAYSRVADNPATFTWGLVITAIAGVAAGIEAASSVGFLWLPLVWLAGLFIGAGVLHVVAMLFGGKGDIMGMIRIMGLAAMIGWAQVIPVVGGIVGLWWFPVLFLALQEHQKLDATKAIIVLLIPSVVFFLFLLLFMGAFLALLFA